MIKRFGTHKEGKLVGKRLKRISRKRKWLQEREILKEGAVQLANKWKMKRETDDRTRRRRSYALALLKFHED